MKHLLIIVTYFTSHLVCLSQGGWDIEYTIVDSINSNLIGEDIKIDFRNKQKELASSHWRYSLSKEDTIQIKLMGETIEFFEKRKIYSDLGFYDEQFLEAKEDERNKTIRIYHTVIKDITRNSILFRFYIEIARFDSAKKSIYNINRLCEDVWISKSKINGVMTKKEN